MIAQCLMQKAVLDYIRVHTHHRVVPRRVTNRRPRSNIIEITWQEVQLRINDNKEKEKYMHVLTIKKNLPNNFYWLKTSSLIQQVRG